MAHIVEDRVLESTTTTGTGVLTLAGAVTGFRRFSAVCAVGDTVPYFIEAVDSVGLPTGDYEYGIGTYSAANQLTRTTILGSSNGGAVVAFAAGSKNVSITLLSYGVKSGSNANGSWKRHPDGTLEQWGSALAFPASGSAVVNNFPVAFVGTPTLVATHIGTVHDVNVIVDIGLSATQFALRTDYTLSNVTAMWHAKGRWIA